MNWQILGAGAIGCLFAGNLAKQRQNVSLLTKTQRPNQALQLTETTGITHSFTLNGRTEIDASADVLLVCLKAFQVVLAFEQLQPHIPKQMSVVLMHNGMGTLAPLQKLMPEQRLFCATTTHGALLNEKFSVTHTGIGSTLIGGQEQDKELGQSIAIELNRALANTSWSDHINEKLWLKLAINCAINPLTAIHQIKNGELLQPQFRPILAQICLEFCQVANQQELALTPEALLEQVQHVAQATAANYSSMNRDIYHGRPTENEAILGYLLQCAQQHQIALPVCQQLYQQVQRLSV
ncbi:ketopantoate reductase family protein [Motilimonas eburnea]|uniref:ketopantoate reductase family protein n=1 Tax=Motilimonas eburnea TaxID=1737488 RepID=UPI001E5EC246|nr:2-dehydropantoate 2-reductase [Motilimonas eburnea]MCE2573786.1 2-dehydropantoate 2-reductase [Motilimonas eburnea]